WAKYFIEEGKIEKVERTLNRILDYMDGKELDLNLGQTTDIVRCCLFLAVDWRMRESMMFSLPVAKIPFVGTRLRSSRWLDAARGLSPQIAAKECLRMAEVATIWGGNRGMLNQLYQWVLLFDPAYSVAHRRLFYLYLHAGEYRKALKSLARAKRHRETLSTLLCEAILHKEQNRFDETLAVFRLISRQFPYAIQFYYGILYCRLNHKRFGLSQEEQLEYFLKKEDLRKIEPNEFILSAMIAEYTENLFVAIEGYEEALPRDLATWQREAVQDARLYAYQRLNFRVSESGRKTSSPLGAHSKSREGTRLPLRKRRNGTTYGYARQKAGSALLDSRTFLSSWIEKGTAAISSGP
ncbi:MAG: hypothetical protein KAS66_15655, partial [Candidatus Omnitrophica bacterium]|nr:hypothetical protein [Candidatus Omnitrophota bacterium]